MVKCKHWTDAHMKAAMEAVSSESSVNRTAVDHGVPWTMLKDRLAGQVRNEYKPGPKPYLDQSEEKKLGDFCDSALQLSMGRHANVMPIAQSVATSKGFWAMRE